MPTANLFKIGSEAFQTPADSRSPQDFGVDPALTFFDTRIMNDEIYPLYRLLKEDRRYPLEAYQFVRDALSFAQDDLNMGTDSSGDPGTLTLDDPKHKPERHLTGQELCEAIRLYAIDQYGYMAMTVLSRWGLQGTGDFGNVVYNLISIGWMRKSKNDRREHFDDVYDFQKVFLQEYEFSELE